MFRFTEENGQRLLEQQRVCAEAAADANAELQTVEAEYETVMAQVSTMTTKEMELANALEELDASIRTRKQKASCVAFSDATGHDYCYARCMQRHYCMCNHS